MTDLLRLRAYALVSYFEEDGALDRFGVLANRPCLAELVDELRDALMPANVTGEQPDRTV